MNYLNDGNKKYALEIINILIYGYSNLGVFPEK